jgi:hypothetical protein
MLAKLKRIWRHLRRMYRCDGFVFTYIVTPFNGKDGEMHVYFSSGMRSRMMREVASQINRAADMEELAEQARGIIS